MCRPDTPAMLHYETLLGSLYDTPPCWSIYICGLVFEYLLEQVRQAVQAWRTSKMQFAGHYSSI
jgi:phosphoserine aminotransferase